MAGTRRMSGGKRKGTRKNNMMEGGKRKGTRKNNMMEGGKRKGTRKNNMMEGGKRKRKPSPWNDFVKKIFKDMRRKDKDASFGEALKEASRRKNEM